MRDDLLQILDLVRRKQIYDHEKALSKGSAKYLPAVEGEVLEVREELKKSRLAYLEDELGDVLWTYLNLVASLGPERGVEIERVFQRCRKKFEERVEAIENNGSWAEVKKVQKERLAAEENL